jgi:membrane protein implicated in regulation of membrane protease activity
MMDVVIKLGTWNWLILAAVLMSIETFAPGVFMFWLGLAALIVGVLAAAVALSWQGQLLMFGMLAVAMVPLWRHFARRNAAPTDSPFLNRRAAGLVGREFTLDKPIVDGVGTIRIDDTVWRVSGTDAPAGSRVKVVQADGANLRVGPVVQS